MYDLNWPYTKLRGLGYWEEGGKAIPSRRNRMNQGREVGVHLRYVVLTLVWQATARYYCFCFVFHLERKH